MNAEVQQSTALMPVVDVDALELFTGGGLDGLLGMIEQEALKHEQSVETADSRALIASMAYKVARSKTTIDDAGKTLVAEWKKQAGAVDAGRKKARDFLDDLKARVRAPLTEWEAEQERIAEALHQARQMEIAHAEALELDALFERERAVKEREEELRREGEERARKDAAERAAKEQAEREERIRQDAEAKAKREAEQALQRERERAERAEAATLWAVENERKKAERDAQKEVDRLEAIEAQKREEAKRAADKENRDKVNAAIVAAFMAEGMGVQTAEKVIRLVSSGAIPSMSIRY